MAQHEVVICAPQRTAIGTFGGTLKATPAPALGEAAISAVLSRSGLPRDAIGTAMMGNVIQAGTKIIARRST